MFSSTLENCAFKRSRGFMVLSSFAVVAPKAKCKAHRARIVERSIVYVKCSGGSDVVLFNQSGKEGEIE